MATPKLVVNGNTVTFPQPIDNPVVRPMLRKKDTESKAGNRDTWTERTEYELTFTVRYVPKATVGSATGYSSANGWTTALLYLMEGGHTGAFHPDASSGTNKTVELIDFDFDRDVRRDKGGARYAIDLRLRASSIWTEY